MSKHLNSPDTARVQAHLALHQGHKRPSICIMLGSKLIQLRIVEMATTLDDEPSLFLEPVEIME